MLSGKVQPVIFAYDCSMLSTELSATIVRTASNNPVGACRRWKLPKFQWVLLNSEYIKMWAHLGFLTFFVHEAKYTLQRRHERNDKRPRQNQPGTISYTFMVCVDQPGLRMSIKARKVYWLGSCVSYRINGDTIFIRHQESLPITHLLTGQSPPKATWHYGIKMDTPKTW